MGLLVGVGSTKPKFPYDNFYGIEWDTLIASPACTRLGRPELHVSLPIQSRMRRCILNDAGKVVYYLHAQDSTKRDNGAAADLTGASGQVMVEIPEHFIRFEMEGTKRRCLMSSTELPGFRKVPTMYVSAYEASLQRSTLKLSSVVNNSADYRGGANQTAWDAESKTQLGRPATAISLTNFRAYARNRGSVNWNCDTYAVYRSLYWLFAVEYANFNSQSAFNPAPTSEGFKQGGLGPGVTTINSTKWSTFNAYYPLLPCGVTNPLGNATGVINYNLPPEYDTNIFTVQVPAYRGVENPFGHLWSWVDGCKVRIQSDEAGGLSEFYVCDNPADFQSTNYDKYDLRGVLPRVSGYIKEMIVGEFGEIMPSVATGAASTTYFSDYFYTSLPATGESQRGVLFGGSSATGTSAGFGCSYTSNAPSLTSATIGSRLCYLTGVE